MERDKLYIYNQKDLFRAAHEVNPTLGLLVSWKRQNWLSPRWRRQRRTEFVVVLASLVLAANASGRKSALEVVVRKEREPGAGRRASAGILLGRAAR